LLAQFGAVVSFVASMRLAGLVRRTSRSATGQSWIAGSAGLVPAGFVVESAFCDADTTVITVRPSQGFGLCPSCGTVSRRVHSHYRRRVRELPLSGRTVELVVIARRFRCEAVLCGRQIFTERFAEGILAPWARRTSRLDGIVHHLGLALGGRPAAIFAKRLMPPVSKDTLLRAVTDTVSGYINGLLNGVQFKRTCYALDQASREATLARLFTEIEVEHPTDNIKDRIAA
jgi:zinc-finger of transposase IS204/IS1001/IS1096/IS1165